MAGQVLATTFVEPRGTIRSVIAGVVGHEIAGAAGTVAASQSSRIEGTSPLHKGDIGYFAVDQVVLYRAKRGAFKPKPTEEVVASGPFEMVKDAQVERKKISGVLTVRFADGSEWMFDIPKVHLATAEVVAHALTTRHPSG